MQRPYATALNPLLERDESIALQRCIILQRCKKTRRVDVTDLHS
jgi:hypothetical protein